MSRLADWFPSVVRAWSKVVDCCPSWPDWLPRRFSLTAVLVLMAVLGVVSAVSASYWQAYAKQAALEAHWASIGIEIYENEEPVFKNLWAFQKDLTRSGNVLTWKLPADLDCIMLCECEIEGDQLTGIDQFPDLIGLHFRHTDVTDVAIDQIMTCRRLKFISLQQAQVSPAGLARLQTIPSLEELTVNGESVLTASP